MRDMRKPHYESHASDPMYQPMKKAITRLWKCYYAAFNLQASQSDEKGHTYIYHIIIYSWHKITYSETCNGVSLDLWRNHIYVNESKWYIWF